MEIDVRFERIIDDDRGVCYIIGVVFDVNRFMLIGYIYYNDVDKK